MLGETGDDILVGKLDNRTSAKKTIIVYDPFSHFSLFYNYLFQKPCNLSHMMLNYALFLIHQEGSHTFQEILENSSWN